MSEDPITDRIVIGWFAVQVKMKREGRFVQLKYNRFLVAELAIDQQEQRTRWSPQYVEMLKRAFSYVMADWKPKKKTANPDFASDKMEQATIAGTDVP